MVQFRVRNTLWLACRNTNDAHKRWGHDRFACRGVTCSFWWIGPLFVEKQTGRIR